MSASGESLTPTGRAVLGMVAAAPLSGYDIKQLVDRSARYFWAASYGQIYPELRRLHAAGLVEPAPDPAGARPRVRWLITGAGRQALSDWLSADDDGGTFELRSEGMLRLFLLDGAPPGERAAILQRIADRHARMAAELEEIRPLVKMMPFSDCEDVLDLGIDLHTLAAERFARLAEGNPDPEPHR
ncbi:MAG TPA: PadR family transcriptional regulator [Solirubrobacteraceae bacterium]|jgi:DNA-binding PadR family transcriptional regulator|nr:PadR family transcriptional regulator [Solirubrobacteraceae bacterium]